MIGEFVTFRSVCGQILRGLVHSYWPAMDQFGILVSSTDLRWVSSNRVIR